MAVERLLSQQALEYYLKAIDPSVEVFVPDDLGLAMFIMENPPAGKLLAFADGGGNDILLVYCTSGAIAGIQAVKVKGNQFVVATGGALLAPVLGKPVTVLTFTSPQALEDYLALISPGATVDVYADEGSADNSGAVFKITCNQGQITVIRGSGLADILFILDKGGFYTIVRK